MNLIRSSMLALFFTLTASTGFCADKNSETAKETNPKGEKKMAKVTGIGGVFFKAKNPKETAEWYKKNLGLSLEPWGGAILRWSEDKAEDGGATVWHAMAQDDSEFFSPSKSAFMINYRIDSMEKMVEQLKQNGVKPVKGPESHENGKFLWVMDPDGNKVELWEPMNWDDKNKQK